MAWAFEKSPYVIDSHIDNHVSIHPKKADLPIEFFIWSAYFFNQSYTPVRCAPLYSPRWQV